MVATAISGTTTPEICFLPGQLRRTVLPKERYGDSLSVSESATATQPSNWEADTQPLNYRCPSEIFFANAWVSGDVMTCSWGVAE